MSHLQVATAFHFRILTFIVVASAGQPEAVAAPGILVAAEDL
jgi:hypothetical protein